MKINLLSVFVLAVVSSNTHGDAKYSTFSDPMTDKVSHHVEISSKNDSTSLMLNCFLNNDGNAEYIEMYLYVGSTVDDDHQVSLRVDKRKAHQYWPDSSASLKQLYITGYRGDGVGNSKETMALIDELKSGAKLLISYYEWPGQAKYATYNLSGSKSTIDRIENVCRRRKLPTKGD